MVRRNYKELTNYQKYLMWKDLSHFFLREGNEEMAQEVNDVAIEYWQKFWEDDMNKFWEEYMHKTEDINEK